VVAELIGLLHGTAQDPRRLTFAVALPLLQPAPARSLLLRFWIELSLLLTWRHAPTLSLFFSAERLWLCFRQPAGALFTVLLDPGRATRTAWEPGSQTPPPGIPVPRPAAGISGEMTLFEVLKLVRGMGPPHLPRWLGAE
jgi:hypothetical protein